MASDRTMEEIAAGKGRRPKPFMLAGKAAASDAVWHSNRNGKGNKASFLKRSSSQRPQHAAEANGVEDAAVHRAPALQASEPAACRCRLGPRDQARRLSHAAACRRWQGGHAHAQRARLDVGLLCDRGCRRVVWRTASSTERSWRSITMAHRISPPCKPRCPRDGPRT